MPTWAAPQSPSPASAVATASVSPRDASYKPYLRMLLTSVGSVARCEWNGRGAGQGGGTGYSSASLRASNEADHSSARNSSSVVDRILGEHVLHHADLAVVVERDVDVRVRDEVDRQQAAVRAAHGEPHRPAGRGQERERGREHGPWLVLGVTEEAPGPLPPLDLPCRELAELGAGGVEACGHEVHELAGGQAERRPVELLVREEAVVLAAARAVEPHAKDGRVRSAGEPLDAPEGREQHLGLASHRTRERVAARERVVHADVVETTPDGERVILST